MGDIIIIFFLQNILIFSMIFWLLTWVCEYFYKKKGHLSKKQTYECGFKAFDTLNIQINLNFILLCVFLVLYDLELILLIPFIFNIYNTFLYQYLILIIFFILLLISLIYDWNLNALSWQY